MPDIQFYHLTSTPVERALPKLLEKAYSAGLRTVVAVSDAGRMDVLNEWLWTYDPASFLPHGSEKDNHRDKQPILISTRDEPENQASLIVVTDGRPIHTDAPFTRIIDMFDGTNEEAVASARQRWSAYKQAGCPLTYLRQTEQGGWETKATA